MHQYLSDPHSECVVMLGRVSCLAPQFQPCASMLLSRADRMHRVMVHEDHQGHMPLDALLDLVNMSSIYGYGMTSKTNMQMMLEAFHPKAAAFSWSRRPTSFKRMISVHHCMERICSTLRRNGWAFHPGFESLTLEAATFLMMFACRVRNIQAARRGEQPRTVFQQFGQVLLLRGPGGQQMLRFADIDCLVDVLLGRSDSDLSAGTDSEALRLAAAFEAMTLYDE